MSHQLTVSDARESLTLHLESKGHGIREQYGPDLGWKQLLQVLADRKFVRYPCEIVFDTAGLEAGEFAHPVANGVLPEEGFTLHVHPLFLTQLHQVPYLVLYQLVLVNYGEFATPDDAETFGSAALGISKQAYYDTLCELADCVPQ